MTGSIEERKHEESEFHDRLRGLYEKDPEAYAHYTSNQKFYSVAGRSYNFVQKWLRSHATGKRVLEYGCGSGSYAVSVASFAKQVTGIDISSQAIKLSEERAAAAGVSQNTSFLVMDAEQLGFESGSFDIVSESGVLHHLELRDALNQIHRVLSADGQAICLEAIANNPLIHRYRKTTPHLRTAWETEHILRAESVSVMREFFGAVEVRFFHLAVLAAVPIRNKRGFKAVVAVLDCVDSILLRIPILQRQAWMACFILSQPLRK